MNIASTLTRRGFILAGAALGLMAALPGRAHASDAPTTTSTSSGFDPTGTWVLVDTACDDEEVAESLALIAALTTTFYELRADGTLTCTTMPMELGEEDGEDALADGDTKAGSDDVASAAGTEQNDDASSANVGIAATQNEANAGSDGADAAATSGDAEARGTEADSATQGADEQDLSRMAVDDLNDALAGTTTEEGHWEITGEDQVTLTTDDGAALVCVKDGLGLTYTGRDEEGLTITMTFARPKDVLDGSWAMAASPETFEAEREGVEGRWGCVAWADPSLDEVQAAHFTAIMLGLYGTAWTLDILDDGSLAMQVRSAGEDEPTATEGAWHETAAGSYECEIGDDTLSFELSDGRLILAMDESTLVFAPLSQTA